jgi:hypothetical protein
MKLRASNLVQLVNKKKLYISMGYPQTIKKQNKQTNECSVVHIYALLRRSSVSGRSLKRLA